MTESPIYYRLIVSLDVRRAIVVTMQDFDEHDYDHSRYITDKKFDTKDDAWAFALEATCHPNVPEHIKDLLHAGMPLPYSVDRYMYTVSFRK